MKARIDCGNGLGRDIAEAALAAGDSVVAGARRTEELAPSAIRRAGETRTQPHNFAGDAPFCSPMT
jgi:NAD(P)-dependent dehydrogenase (short-subunit alcohol dehydrogenase family)